MGRIPASVLAAPEYLRIGLKFVGVMKTVFQDQELSDGGERFGVVHRDADHSPIMIHDGVCRTS